MERDLTHWLIEDIEDDIKGCEPGDYNEEIEEFINNNFESDESYDDNTLYESFIP